GATPDAVAFVDGRSDRRLTWADIGSLTHRWAERRPALARRGPVGLLTADPLRAAASVVAGLGAGVSIAPLDPGARRPELPRTVRPLGLAGLVSDLDGDVTSVLAGAGVDVWADDGPRLVEGRLGPPPRPSALDAALVMVSSGTTGAPKIVPLGVAQLLHAARAVVGHHPLRPP